MLLAKYEVEDGGFVYEKDGDFLNVGDHYTFRVTDTKDDGEILAFEVETDGTYPFDGLTVKTGEGCFDKTFPDAEKPKAGQTETFDAREFDENNPVQAVSNVRICTSPIWQVDFGTGPVPEPPDYGKEADSELLMAEFGTGGTDSDAGEADKNSLSDNDAVTVPDPEGFEVDDGNISVTFNVTENDTDVHIAVFNKPGPEETLDLDRLDVQELHDKQRKTYHEGEKGTLTVDLPSVDDY